MSQTRSVLTAGLLAVLASVLPAPAKEWEWSYDPGTSLPDTFGWRFISQDPPAKRWVEGGQIHFDSRPPNGLWGGYDREFPNGGIVLGSGETFIIRARLKVDYVSTWFADPTFGLWADNGYGGSFNFGVSRVWATGNYSAEFEPNVFHEYEMRSRDLRSYDFFIDEILAWHGNFVWGGGGMPYIFWGDGGTNQSLSHWDFVSFAIVADARRVGVSARNSAEENSTTPEPSPVTAIALLFALGMRRGWVARPARVTQPLRKIVPLGECPACGQRPTPAVLVARRHGRRAASISEHRVPQA